MRPSTPSFEVGSLVQARGREWVVLPESRFEEQLLVLRPLGGADAEITGVYLPLETVEPAEFALPDPETDLGSDADCGLLRDAARLGFRAGTGPFRALGGIAIEPRPYQLVPLLMALRLDPVRLLIADDVGIGKTIEALLIARELWDRGEVTSLAVLCPPHLAEQWHKALTEQFHFDAALVLPGTARRLEKGMGPGESLFDRHKVTVISLDWIKNERRRHEFVRVCPDLVIVDEAHTCTANSGIGRSAQQRHALLERVAQREGQHMLLVTATPHSGKEDDFRSLLALLNPKLASLPTDLSGDEHRRDREALARHLVQRRRGDIVSYLGEHTNFPRRESSEAIYALSRKYLAYLDEVLAWCREQVEVAGEDRREQRIRWWSALALLRAVSSSPAAAAATLRNRAASADAETAEEVDTLGRRLVLDEDDDAIEAADLIPGSLRSDDDGEGGLSPAERARLKRLAESADALAGQADTKLADTTRVLQDLLDKGHNPIVFCRFIPTVEYVSEHLRGKLKDAHVEPVTGQLPPDERERRVADAGQHPRRVLVCTDCLSEGINLQDAFDTVVHYDLAWNPTRHEQREGRVDRYGQRRRVVRTLTVYGRDNPVDGVVLDVLIRKHKAIQKQLGITVPVPTNTSDVMEALLQGLILRRGGSFQGQQLGLPLGGQKARQLDLEWTAAAEREKRSRSLFAQATIKVDEVQQELRESRASLGDAATLATFTRLSLLRMGVPVSGEEPLRLSLSQAHPLVQEATGLDADLDVRFRPEGDDEARVVTRTDPLVAGLARHVLEAALDPTLVGGKLCPARRLGVVKTDAVAVRTTLLLLRLRFAIHVPTSGGTPRELLAEEVRLAAFVGRPKEPQWLGDVAAEALLEARPTANLPDDVKRNLLRRLLEQVPSLDPHLSSLAQERATALLQAHRRVRKAGGLFLRGLSVEPHEPVDLLGAFIYMPEKL